jgi:hypothetical protein
MPTPHAAIVELLDRYVGALHRGDVDGLRAAFHPRAIYATPSGGSLLHLGLDEYLEVVAKRASPQSRGDSPAYTIDSLQLAGDDAALATLRSEMMGRRFIDFLSLVQTDGQWRIIAKVFHFDPIAPKEG